MNKPNSDDIPPDSWIHQDRMGELGNEDEDYIEFLNQRETNETLTKNKILSFLQKVICSK